MRPPLIRTDMASSLPRAACGPGRTRCVGARYISPLLAALLQDDNRLLPLLPVHVDALLPERCHGLLREVRSVGGHRRRLLDHLELRCDLVRPLPFGRIHHADAELVWPDERVDLVHLPCLVAARQRRALLQDDVDALLEVIAAVRPPAERSLQELDRSRL